MNTTQRKGDWLQTFTGVQFWPLDPRPEDILIDDIAHGLAHICRYGGHCNQFYSVAQHSCLVSDVLAIAGRRYALTGLLHDATEAYIGDMVRPLKIFMPQFRQVEDRLWEVIAERFALPAEMPPCVKEADNLLLVTERRDLMTNFGHRWAAELEAINPLSMKIYPWEPDRAKTEFIKRYIRLRTVA